MHKVYFHLQKGGTGRSLSLYHLACTLGELFNKRILVIDLDAQKNISFLFGINGDDVVRNGGYSIAHALFEDLNSDKERRNLKDCIIKDVAPNVDIVCSSSHMTNADIYISQEKMNGHMLLSWALEDIEDEYDYVFFDSDGTYNQVCTNCIAATDLLIPVAKTDFQCSHRLVETVNMLQNLAKRNKLNLVIGGILCTMYENTGHSNMFMEYVKEYGFNIWGVIKRQVAMQDSTACGKPIYKYAPSNQGSWGIINFAHNILNYFDEDFSIPLDKKYRRKKEY